MSTQNPLFGLAYRREAAQDILVAKDSLDCLEVMVEHFTPLTRARRTELASLAEDFKLLPHCVSLSPGSDVGANPEHWSALKHVIDMIDPPFVSDHASVSVGGGINLGHLGPIWRTEESLQAFVRRLDQLQSFFNVPFAIETITETFRIPDADYDWDDFHVEVCKRSGAGLLVDLANIHINNMNGIWEPKPDLVGSLRDAPWRQMHLVGYGFDGEGRLVDDHRNPIPEELLSSLEDVVSLQVPEVFIVERDGRLDHFHEVLADVQAVRMRVGRTLASQP